MGGARRLGISSTELQAAMEGEGVPPEDQSDTVYRVRIMERVAREIAEEQREQAEREAEQEQRIKSAMMPGRGR